MVCKGDMWKKVYIAVQDNIVTVKYRQGKKVREFKWEDCHDLSQKFLLRLDKINKCNNHIVNCLFNRKSDSDTKPTSVVLRRIGRESTTYRIILITLEALEWANAIKLVEKL